MTNIDDPLWPHFKPLWLDFESASGGVLVAGGYGLFLKQQWLLTQESPQIVIPFERWPEAAPRATGDMDLIVALDLIQNETANNHLQSALKREGFKVSREPRGKRWQFFKELGPEKHVVVELHAPLPEEQIDGLKVNDFTIKHKPSLGDEGIHGRTNPEAIGSEIHPFLVELDSVKVKVPNPVTWSIMKLTAAEDMWKRHRNKEEDATERKYFRDQALKHGHDVCRVVAMMTVEERDNADTVIKAVKDTAPFLRAAAIYQEFFGGEDNWANEVLGDRWLPEDLAIIHSILGSWYSKKE